MKVGIYDPYLDTLGGGEKYVFGIAECFLPKNEVTIFWDDKEIIKKAQEKFRTDLDGLKISKNIFSNKTGVINKYKTTSELDVFFFMSDGAIPLLFSKKNILIFQFPTPWVRYSLYDKIKLKNISSIICYSEFVKKHLKKQFDKRIEIISPYVELNTHRVTKKESIILSVGRFTKDKNRKKQEIMIDAFKSLCKSGVRSWKLVLIGSYIDQDKDFVNDIKKMVDGYPIEIITNSSHQTLLDFYNRSKIYWHAAGYGEDLETHPENAEHFGITTVEAMRFGCVPIVFNGGGQSEIINNNENGFVWKASDELLNITKKVISNAKLSAEISDRARKSCDIYRKEFFCNKIYSIIS